MCLAIPGKIVAIQEGEGFDRRGTVDYDGVRQEVALAYLPEAQIGDYVLVHVGFAMTRLDTAEAERILRELHELENP
ncbi:MAG TPA: HypC/HybG/HupF family hydrogenase formation chaperone [Kiritimatiellia bacterium]|jgi:hydrogenase expression/formation protein HypC|nr:MAG: Hydrogenase isoenzymes formation protein HypC [Verrucomicrobia bacterium ADurb.Bin018]HOE36705.1 HypC/HybG/HupF family hydrogenase formation chaperone [Kiritimatiellia bacterium]HOR74257.1 HypC/HybG/HupF family hydrogenase formation chaperone [Kiritimatiellia bacterium]HOU59456.1 HypC/HybG/HupF family hydrogenase formation chaperone [Kiritimatiellia bacterium]HPK69123.1 HypC/HybG/HupF family hydrogenase formation chaperone [Kiritimatiellia bacterium]